MSTMTAEPTAQSPTPRVSVGLPGEATLAAELTSWLAEQSREWDEAVAGGVTPMPGSEGLWDDLPTIDSKVVARSSAIFERHLGIKLKVDLIRPGGYSGIQDLVEDLVPKMVAYAQRRKEASK